MKNLILTLAVALFASISVAATPYSVDVSWTSGTSSDVVVAQPVQPQSIHMWGVLPAAITATVYRIHGAYTQTVSAVTNAAGTGSVALPGTLWFVAGDILRVSGPTNANVEVQGNGQ